ncbi:hypothetical protein LCGC14_0594270 [marine sediment metagenome]|uniref:Uncharacterized protein n=1 Tax=marine sediment metagenome TaxID=412755 RepID=A0A0F9RCH1_9ZZZZ
MGRGRVAPPIKDGDWTSVRQAINRLSAITLGSEAEPTFAGLTLSGMTVGSVLFAGASGVVSQDNSSLFWDDTNNRLGIGVNTPAYKLDVTSGTDNIVANFESTDAEAFITFHDNTTVTNRTAIGAIGTRMGIFAGGSERISILTGGNVGIGTTTPLSKLSINGGLHVGGDSDAGDNNLLVDGTIGSGVHTITPGTDVTGLIINNEHNSTNPHILLNNDTTSAKIFLTDADHLTLLSTSGNIRLQATMGVIDIRGGRNLEFSSGGNIGNGGGAGTDPANIWATTNITAGDNVITSGGGAGSPSYTFKNGGTSGMWFTIGPPAALNFSVNGTLKGGFQTTGLVMNTGSITDTTGAISFGNENLTTTGLVDMGSAVIGDGTNEVQVSGTGDLVFVGTAGLPFGEAHQTDGLTFNVTMTTVNVWAEVDAATTNINAVDLNLVTFPGDHYLLLTEEGKYFITYSFTAEIDSVAGGDQHVESGIMVNGSIQTDRGLGHEQYAAINKERNLQGHTIIDVPTNGQVSLAIKNTTSGGKVLTIDHLNITVVQHGGT